MVRLLFKYKDELTEVHVHSVTTDLKQIEVSSKVTRYATKWVDMHSFVKDYKLLGTVREFNESDINNMKSDEKF